MLVGSVSTVPTRTVTVAGLVTIRCTAWLGVREPTTVPVAVYVTTPPGDRPYAGFLYGGFGVAADRGDRLDTLALEVGVVGPSSQADRTQTLVHDVLGAQKPRGWPTPLEDEPGVRLVYERKWRFGADLPLPALDLSVDWAPSVTATWLEVLVIDRSAASLIHTRLP